MVSQIFFSYLVVHLIKSLHVIHVWDLGPVNYHLGVKITQDSIFLECRTLLNLVIKGKSED